MARSLFKILAKNPNTRNRKCACGGPFADCTGPYAVFSGSENMDPRNPHVVVSYACASRFVMKAASKATARERDGE